MHLLQLNVSIRRDRKKEQKTHIVGLPRVPSSGGLAHGGDEEVDSKGQVGGFEVRLDVLDLTAEVLGRLVRGACDDGEGRETCGRAGVSARLNFVDGAGLAEGTYVA